MGVGRAPGDGSRSDQVRIDLRLLATTDLHFRMWPHDYATGQVEPGPGLVSAAATIASLRASATNCLLFDNGDLLQGSALADLVARRVMQGRGGPSPIHAVMRALGYDAVSVGNHDLNYGLDYLLRTARSATIPWLSANLSRVDADGWHHPILPGHVLLDRLVRDTDGREHPLRVGVLGVMPAQSAEWDRHILGPEIRTTSMVAAAQKARDALLAEGADIVVALCHSGLDPDEGPPDPEDEAGDIARLDGIDAVVAGHTHMLFPVRTMTPRPHVDPRLGLVHDTPLVLPGSHGNHVGAIDLWLARREGRWRPVSGRARLVAAPVRVPAAAERALAPLRAAHLEVLAESQQPVGETDGPLVSHLSLIGTDPVGRLLADALLRYASAEHLPEPWRDLPLLAATSPNKAGGRTGPGNFLAIPPGPLRRGHLSEIYPFPNTACILGVTGALVRRWLEESARFYSRVPAGATGSRLYDIDDAPYLLDTIWGLRYAIDPGRARSRIRRLRRPDGTAVRDDDRFVLVTNSYRAAGGGQFTMASESEMLRVGQASIQTILHVHLIESGTIVPDYRPAFELELRGGGRVRFPTGPGHALARSLAEDRRVVETGEEREGFEMLDLLL